MISGIMKPPSSREIGDWVITEELIYCYSLHIMRLFSVTNRVFVWNNFQFNLISAPSADPTVCVASVIAQVCASVYLNSSTILQATEETRKWEHFTFTPQLSEHEGWEVSVPVSSKPDEDSCSTVIPKDWRISLFHGCISWFRPFSVQTCWRLWTPTKRSVS